MSSIFSHPQWDKTRNQLYEEDLKIHTYVETKQHAPEQPMSQKRNQRKNKEIPRDKWKRKCNILKFMECSKRNSKGEIHGEKYPPQETWNCQVNNLSLHFKDWKKKQKMKPIVEEGKDQTGSKWKRD